MLNETPRTAAASASVGRYQLSASTNGCFLSQGSHYSLAVAATLADPDAPSVFLWASTDTQQLSDALSIHRITGVCQSTGADNSFQVAVTPCRTVSEEFGQGLAGAGGHVPFLSGTDGSCADFGYVVSIGNAVGNAPGILWIGLDESELDLFGGDLSIDLGTPFLLLPIVLRGAPGVPGIGHLSLPGLDRAPLSGSGFSQRSLRKLRIQASNASRWAPTSPVLPTSLM